MALHLLDTNVMLRAIDPAAPEHTVVRATLTRLAGAGHSLCVTAQNIVEFWSVATRPRAVNGFEWSDRQAEAEVARLRTEFAFLEERPEIFANWLKLVMAHEVRGKQVHDTRLVAVMLAHGVKTLVTLNAVDFKRFGEIEVVVPSVA